MHTVFDLICLHSATRPSVVECHMLEERNLGTCKYSWLGIHCYGTASWLKIHTDKQGILAWFVHVVGCLGVFLVRFKMEVGSWPAL